MVSVPLVTSMVPVLVIVAPVMKLSPVESSSPEMVSVPPLIVDPSRSSVAKCVGSVASTSMMPLVAAVSIGDGFVAQHQGAVARHLDRPGIGHRRGIDRQRAADDNNIVDVDDRRTGDEADTGRIHHAENVERAAVDGGAVERQRVAAVDLDGAAGVKVGKDSSRSP